MKLRKVMAVLLAAALTLSMAACGDKTDTNNNGNNEPQNTEVTNTPDATPTPVETKNDKNSETNEIISIGSWWVQYYDSASTSLEDAEDYVNAIDQETDSEQEKAVNAISRQISQLKWDNVEKIEKEYGVEFYWENLTYTGVQDSINTSILAGAPDCDVYLVDSGMAIPAQANGLAMDLKTFLPADHDIFTEQKIASYIDLGDGKACIFYRISGEKLVEATYPLAFNIQMLEDNNLEDPRELYARGEWDWDKFIEYCQKLTQDTDGDGQIDQYGYCGFSAETFEQLMMSNGAGIANTANETLSTPAVAEALQMVSDMYNVYNVCYPYDFDDNTASTTMRNQYTNGDCGFFPNAAWIMAGNYDYDYDGSKGVMLPFDIAFVRWPVGPSGNKETNPGKNDTAGELYIIPAGVAEPEKVFNVMYDFWDWNDGDTTLRDSKEALNWWFKVTAREEELQNANFAVMEDCGKNTTFDLWQSLGFYYDLNSIINGTMTPAQFQETYKQQVQDALDAYYGNN